MLRPCCRKNTTGVSHGDEKTPRPQLQKQLNRKLYGSFGIYPVQTDTSVPTLAYTLYNMVALGYTLVFTLATCDGHHFQRTAGMQKCQSFPVSAPIGTGTTIPVLALSFASSMIMMTSAASVERTGGIAPSRTAEATPA